jgi:hypothetical protein
MTHGLRWTNQEYEAYRRRMDGLAPPLPMPLRPAPPSVRKPDVFLELCASYSLPMPVCEVLIIPGRDFRADYCWPQQRIVVEQNGYRDHSSKKKLLRDWEKANLAQVAGWRYFQFSPKQLISVDTIEWLRVQLGTP